MNEHDATEIAYKNGYAKGKAEAEAEIDSLISAGFDTVDYAVDKIKQARADTVRKMQERINAHFDSDSDYFRSSHGYIRSVVDQIATEMLEDKP